MSKIKYPVIYVAYCRISEKLYVGQTCNFTERKKQHLRAARTNGTKVPKFCNALRLHGESNFIWSVIECPDISKLTEWELFFVDKFDSIKNGYNCWTPGTEYGELLRKKFSRGGKGKKFSLEARKNMSNAQKNRIRTEEDIRHISKLGASRRGKKHSEENLRAISAGLRGKPLSEAHRRNIGLAVKGKMKGIKFTDEHKLNMSIARKGIGKGIQKTEDHRRNIGLALKGKKFTDEHRLHMSQATKGRGKGESKVFTDKHKYNILLAQQERRSKERVLNIIEGSLPTLDGSNHGESKWLELVKNHCRLSGLVLQEAS